MTIDWSHFTPWLSLAGGLLLGVAAAMFILVNGRVLGISGIVGGLLAPKKGDAAWRVAFLLGMALSPLIFRMLLKWAILSRISCEPFFNFPPEYPS